jgi:UDP-N-acetylmuramyl pentapeptide phosphotransferase/UDP-N-acetylglucosamine-1-phosphate transferase
MMDHISWILGEAAVASIAAVLSTLLILLLRPFLTGYALATPDGRSSHRVPTPQWGGIAVIAATVTVALAAVWIVGRLDRPLLTVCAATVLLALVGGMDDVYLMPALPRLLLQALSVGVCLAAIPADLRVVPFLPYWAERIVLLLGAVWFVNLVNFMDGIDWMTVAEVVPVTGAIALLGVYGTIGVVPTLAATALLGAILGFAPFNKPVARLFLGDVGSLPIGLLLAWLLIEVAGSGHLVAALVLPLYYLADATITLSRRIARGETFWKAHRTHYYQRATDNGFTVPEIVAHVFLVNLALAVLALISVLVPIAVVDLAALAAAAIIVIWLLATFARKRVVI